jgi:hypothetical protein
MFFSPLILLLLMVIDAVMWLFGVRRRARDERTRYARHSSRDA